MGTLDLVCDGVDQDLNVPNPNPNSNPNPNPSTNFEASPSFSEIVFAKSFFAKAESPATRASIIGVISTSTCMFQCQCQGFG